MVADLGYQFHENDLINALESLRINEIGYLQFHEPLREFQLALHVLRET